MFYNSTLLVCLKVISHSFASSSCAALGGCPFVISNRDILMIKLDPNESARIEAGTAYTDRLAFLLVHTDLFAFLKVGSHISTAV